MDFIESSKVELKKQFVDDIKKTVIAFANTSGGTIYLGVEDNGNIIGIIDTDDEMLKLTNMIRDSIKPDITMFISYSREKFNNKEIIVVNIQKGTQRPYYIKAKGLKPEGVYVRQGTSSVPATESAIRKMIKEVDGDSFEQMRSFEQNLTFISASKEFKLRKVSFGINQFKTLKILSTDGIYTNLGLLLSDQCGHTIKAASFEGTTKSIFKDRKEFDGSILKQLNEVYEYISIFNRTRSEFSGLRRLDTRDYPEIALREALLNSIVHRDYSYSSSTLVSIFDDKIEFVSMGGLFNGISLEDIMLGISVARNENLANIFYRLSLIEAYGTGVPKIIKSYENCSVKPKFEITENAFKITLPNVNANLKEHILSEQEEQVINLIIKKTEINRKDLELLLNVSQTMSGRILHSLVNRKIIKKINNGKNTKYTL